VLRQEVKCKRCEKIIDTQRRRGKVVFCSAACRTAWFLERSAPYMNKRKERNELRHVTATRSVLIVALNLLERGWEVYLPFDRVRSDLVGFKGRRAVKFEVRTGRKNPDGTWNWPTRIGDEGKTYAVVALDHGNEVLYEPSIE